MLLIYVNTVYAVRYVVTGYHNGSVGGFTTVVGCSPFVCVGFFLAKTGKNMLCGLAIVNCK